MTDLEARADKANDRSKKLLAKGMQSHERLRKAKEEKEDVVKEMKAMAEDYEVQLQLLREAAAGHLSWKKWLRLGFGSGFGFL